MSNVHENINFTVTKMCLCANARMSKIDDVIICNNSKRSIDLFICYIIA